MADKKIMEIGWEEWVALPELKLPAIKAKVDTGARTSALHAFMVEKIIEDGDVKVHFGIHPIPERPEVEIYCKAHLVSEREVTSSNGQTELRYVIRTMAQFGKKKWPIEITLTDRETMAYRMLIGRSAMEGKLRVIPEHSFMLGALCPSDYDDIVPKRKKRKMKICILSRSRNIYTTDRIASAAESRGHKVEVINTTRCYVDISSHKPSIHYQGHSLPRFDALFAHIHPSITYYGVAILRQFESMGTFCINSSSSIAHSRDRLLAHQLLGRAGVSMPTTAFAHYPGDTKDMIQIVGGAPLVIKLLDGQQGNGAVLAQTNKAAEAVIQAFRGLKANFIAQEYIHEPKTKDILCVVLGNKIITAIEQDASTLELLNDEVSHKKSHVVEITPLEKKMAIRAVRVLGLKFAAVNFLRTKAGPRIVDVNCSPSFKRIEKVSGLDLGSLIVDYIEHHARPRLPKRVIGYSI